jgi:hypothetical protein
MIDARWIPGYTNRYWVTENGEVFSVVSNRFIKARDNGSGYLQVRLTGRTGTKKNLYVHRLVMLAFCGRPSKVYNQVDHRNRNPKDNRLRNLAYVTAQENSNNRKPRGKI